MRTQSKKNNTERVPSSTALLKNDNHHNYTTVQIALVGDSDISRWPSSLLPDLDKICLPNISNDIEQNHAHHLILPPINVGVSGATLDEVPSQIQTVYDRLDQMNRDNSNTTEGPHILIFVACAGENDVSSGVSIEKATLHFENSIDSIFLDQGNEKNMERRLIFISPKLEPWLTHDFCSRKIYHKLTKSMNRAINRNLHASLIRYIDCLTMFCGESANVPGAIQGNRAMPEQRFFNDDGLHLSEEGYALWKDAVEKCIIDMNLLSNRREQL
mmetsp:Transcript_31503/g.45974  ORF Transcript_31503/g.45974 Transcript_31503/m.45974 type:complete len:272 (+) Transcript_31503:125-940(+)